MAGYRHGPGLVAVAVRLRDRLVRRLTLTTGTDQHGVYAWIETRLPGGRLVNRLAAVWLLRRRYPDAYAVDVVEQWHVPLSHYAFKVRFQW